MDRVDYCKKHIFALQNRINSEPCLPWLNKLWRLQLPLKLKLFSWLVGNNKLLTWEVLQRRGWVGPSLCLLCKAAPENLFHLLMHCPFSKEVWHRITVHYNLLSSWSGSTIMDSFPCWLTRSSSPPCLVIHFCWQIWLERNRVLFEDSRPNPPRVYSKILASFNWNRPRSEIILTVLYQSTWPRGTLLPFLTELRWPMDPTAAQEVSSSLTSPGFLAGS
jgi:hypothetical protein